MFCTVTVEPGARLSLQRLCLNLPATEQQELRECAYLLERWLQYNPNLQGVRSITQAGYKTLICGPIYALYQIMRPIARQVIIRDYGRNPNWKR
jgi:hypothetical protein